MRAHVVLELSLHRITPNVIVILTKTASRALTVSFLVLVRLTFALMFAFGHVYYYLYKHYNLNVKEHQSVEGISIPVTLLCDSDLDFSCL